MMGFPYCENCGKDLDGIYKSFCSGECRKKFFGLWTKPDEFGPLVDIEVNYGNKIGGLNHEYLGNI